MHTARAHHAFIDLAATLGSRLATQERQARLAELLKNPFDGSFFRREQVLTHMSSLSVLNVPVPVVVGLVSVV